MTLPSSGTMTAAMINTELGRTATAAFNINGSAERTLANVPSGLISMYDFYGKRTTGWDTINTLPETLWSSGGMTYGNHAPGAWVDGNASGTWLGNASGAAGISYFHRPFGTTGLVGWRTVRIQGYIVVDNYLHRMYINSPGVGAYFFDLSGYNIDYAHWQWIDVTISAYLVGSSELLVEVENAVPTGNPVGLGFNSASIDIGI